MIFEIRKISKDVLKIVQDIAEQVIRKRYCVFFTRDAIDWFITSGESDKEFVKHFENCNILVKNSQIVGFNIFFDNFIHLMMVDIYSQRSGYGTILLKFAEERIKEKDYKIMKLETFKENINAVNFYLKNGWIIKDEKKEKTLGVTRIFFEKTVFKIY